MLNSKSFSRIHRSYIVNLTHIKSIQKNKVLIIDKRLPIILNDVRHKLLLKHPNRPYFHTYARALHILFLIIRISYLQIFVNQYFIFEILVPSFLVYPHVYFLLARSEMLSKYQNKEANVSELLYISIVLVSSYVSYILGYNKIYPILTTFVLSTFRLQLYMIFSQKINKKHV